MSRDTRPEGIIGFERTRNVEDPAFDPGDETEEMIDGPIVETVDRPTLMATPTGLAVVVPVAWLGAFAVGALFGGAGTAIAFGVAVAVAL
jgi:hypothetical protein